jgi:REP element-mobilizing transposase RayT
VQSRFLLRPSESANEIIAGVIAKGLKEYPSVKLHAIAVLSNHVQGLASADDGVSISTFMGYIKGNVARKLGRKVKWREKFWGRRVRLIPVLDEESQIARLKYILSQSVQEGLVPRPELWPGIHCARALTRGEPIQGTWFNQTQEYYARRAGEEPGPRDFATPLEITLSPLPCWAGLTVEERQAAAQALVDQVVRENEVPGRSWLGVDAILAQDPHEMPRETAKSPAPVCHAGTLERWKAYKDFYRELVAAYEAVSSLFRRGRATLVDFPAFCFPPRLPWRSTGRDTVFSFLDATAASPSTA